VVPHDPIDWLIDLTDRVSCLGNTEIGGSTRHGPSPTWDSEGLNETRCYIVSDVSWFWKPGDNEICVRWEMLARTHSEWSISWTRTMNLGHSVYTASDQSPSLV
jgi:hypothetical protein